MKKPKIFIACDTTSIKKIKKIITNSQSSKINFGYKFGLEFLNSKNGRKFISKLKSKVTFGDYKLADKIRVELANKGVIIEDKKEKTIWKFK